MKRTNRFYLIIIIACLIIIGFSTYYTLGGFDPVEVFVMEGKGRTIIGKEYIEKYRYVDFSERMNEAKAEVDSGKLEGMLTVIFYENDTIGLDSAHYFIGASTDEINDVLRLPSGYSFKEYRTDKIFKVFMTQHEFVRPRPEKIAELVQVKAIEEGVILQPFSFELYYSDGSFSVEFWAR